MIMWTSSTQLQSTFFKEYSVVKKVVKTNPEAAHPIIYFICKISNIIQFSTENTKKEGSNK